MNRKTILILLLFSIFAFAAVILSVILIGNNSSNKFIITSKSQKSFLILNNETSMNQLIETIGIFKYGAYNETTGQYVNVDKVHIFLTDETQQTIKTYGDPKIEETLMASSSYSLNSETIDIYININEDAFSSELDKNFELNLQLVQQLLGASKKDSQRIEYNLEGARKIVSKFYLTEEDLSGYPITIRKN